MFSTLLAVMAVSAPAANAANPVEQCLTAVEPYDGTDRQAESEIRLKAGAAQLVMLGVEHSRDPDHPQNARLAEAFKTLSPHAAFYEGPDRGVRETREQTIAETGESGLVRYLATKHGAEILRLEPEPQDELLFVLEAFPMDQTALFYLLRSTAQWRERENLSPEQIEARMAAFLERVNGLFATLPEPHATFRIESPAALGQLARKYWPDRDWREAPMIWFSPENRSAETGGIFTNEINMRSSHYRDRVIFSRVAARLANGKRVFVALGGDHLPRLRPGFTCLERVLKPTAPAAQ